MKDYYELFVQLSLIYCKKEEYSCSKKVKAHNVAQKKLLKLQDELIKNKNYDIMLSLLEHEDEHVALNAAMMCLKANVHNRQARLIIERIYTSSKDELLRFSADMILHGI